jgi:hypothetical protein
MLKDWETRVLNATISLEREEIRTPKLPSLRRSKDFRGFSATEDDTDFIPPEPVTYEDFVLSVS